jgi:biopolymer transport protein ExbD
MTEKRRFLDVWIVESNTVYREVPFTVVSDWIQQARLLAYDMIRPSGTADWFKVGSSPEFAAYLPRTEPFRAEDQAEALEPVQIDFAWKAKPDDDEDDVDMIPLIDISLVLLIFFMMTSSVAVAAMRGDVPEVQYSELLGDPKMIWIGVERNNRGQPVYSIGQGETGAAKQDRELTQAQVLEKLDARLQNEQLDVRIIADKALPRKVVKDLTVELSRRQTFGERRPGVVKIYAEVAEKPLVE